MDLKTELGKIGVRGGHAVGDNVLPAKYGFPAYVEGAFVHRLAQCLAKKFSFINLEPETQKLAWQTVAKRGRDADCNTILYCHTNFSLNKQGAPNSGVALIIYPFENERYKALYEKMARTIAHHMDLPKWEVRIRMSTRHKNKNYYSALHYGKKYGIKHPLICEFGYHVDIAGNEDVRIAHIVSAFNDMLGVHDTKPLNASLNDVLDLKALRDKLLGVVHMIDGFLDALHKP